MAMIGPEVMRTPGIEARYPTGAADADGIRPALATCIGAGGVVGVAVGLGAVEGLRRAGFPVPAGPLLGTSSGAWVAAAVATGAEWGDVRLAAGRWNASGPTAHLHDVTTELFGARTDRRVSVVARRLASGRSQVLSAANLP